MQQWGWKLHAKIDFPAALRLVARAAGCWCSYWELTESVRQRAHPTASEPTSPCVAALTLAPRDVKQPTAWWQASVTGMLASLNHGWKMPSRRPRSAVSWPQHSLLGTETGGSEVRPSSQPAKKGV